MEGTAGPRRDGQVNRYLEYSVRDLDAIVETLRELVELESCSSDKVSVDRIGRYVRRRLEEMGARVDVVPQSEVGDQLLADIGEGSKQVLVLCHLDTIWPQGTIRRQPFRVEHGLAYGPGIFDMKASIALLLHALKTLRASGEEPKRRVRVFFNSDEETGSATSRSLIEANAKQSAAVLCLEPALGPEGSLKTARKGLGIFNVRVRGRAAHAGNDPQKGISAIAELAHQIVKLHGLTDYESGTTVNVGVVKGGVVGNQVAPCAEAVVDLRAATVQEADKAVAAILGLRPVLPGAVVEVTGGLNRPVMERTEATARLFDRASEIARTLGIELTEASAGGGSDGQFAAAVGAPVLDGLGAIGDGMFTECEHVRVESLPQRVALLASLLAHV